MPMNLIRPAEKYADQVMAFCKGMLIHGESLDGCASLEEVENFEEWVHSEERGKQKHREGYIPSEVLLAVREEDDCLLGIIDYRHPLTSFLTQYGGSIGYSIHPSERRKGYAVEMLRQKLLICRDYGETTVLLTCDPANTGSRKNHT